MKTMNKKRFDTVKHFRTVKKKLAKEMEGMSLKEKQEFLKKVKEKKITFK